MEEQELIRREAILELESADPEDLVQLLELTSEQIIRAFPGRAFDYVREHFAITDRPEIDENDDEEGRDDLERLLDEGFHIDEEAP